MVKITLRRADDAQLSKAERELAEANRELKLELAQVAIDMVGLVDPTPVSDVVGAGLSLYRGDLVGAGLSLISVVPYVGDTLGKTAKGARAAKKIAALRKRIAGLAALVQKLKTTRTAKGASRAHKAVAKAKQAPSATPGVCIPCQHKKAAQAARAAEAKATPKRKPGRRVSPKGGGSPLKKVPATKTALTAARQRGVRRAWRQEKELVRQKRKGTRRWTAAEKKELLERGRVHGYQGHHINSVEAHPRLADHPDNIKFVNRKEHLKEHHGDFRTPTFGKLVNRSKLLKPKRKR
jgi:hypothetical protein